MQRLLLEDFIRRFETRYLILMGMQSFPNNISGCYLKRIEQAEYFHSTPLKQKHYFKRISITNLLSVFHRTASCKLIENKPIINNNVVWWCPWLNCAHSGMLWKISSLCTSLRTKSSLTIKTDDITSSRIKGRGSAHTGGYGWLRGEWLNEECFPFDQNFWKFGNSGEWYGNSPGKFPESPRIVEFLKCEPFNQKL